MHSGCGSGDTSQRKFLHITLFDNSNCYIKHEKNKAISLYILSN